jgi:hypothetical protein
MAETIPTFLQSHCKISAYEWETYMVTEMGKHFTFFLTLSSLLYLVPNEKPSNRKPPIRRPPHERVF